MPIEQIIISGSAGLLAGLDGDGGAQLFCFPDANPQTMTKRAALHLLSDRTDLAYFGGHEVEAAVKQLSRDVGVSEALTLFLLLSDPGADPDKRQVGTNAALLRKRLADDNIAAELFRRMLRGPLPDGLDLTRLADDEGGPTASFVDLLAAVQSELRAVRESLQDLYADLLTGDDEARISHLVQRLQADLADAGAYYVGGAQKLIIDPVAAMHAFSGAGLARHYEYWRLHITGTLPFDSPGHFDTEELVLREDNGAAIAVAVDDTLLGRQALAEPFDLPAFVPQRVNPNPSAIDVPTLIAAGVHIGKLERDLSAAMRPWVFGSQNGRCILDPRATLAGLEKAATLIQSTLAEGGRLLFVGSREDVSPILENAAKRCGQMWVTAKWAPNLLSNWTRTQRLVLQMDELESHFRTRPKASVNWRDRRRSLVRGLAGAIDNSGSRPALLIVIDGKHEAVAAAEAASLDIPVIAILDIDGDPEGITVPVPGGLAEVRSIAFYCQLFSDAALFAGGSAVGGPASGFGNLGRTLPSSQITGFALDDD